VTVNFPVHAHAATSRLASMTPNERLRDPDTTLMTRVLGADACAGGTGLKACPDRARIGRPIVPEARMPMTQDCQRIRRSAWPGGAKLYSHGSDRPSGLSHRPTPMRVGDLRSVGRHRMRFASQQWPGSRTLAHTLAYGNGQARAPPPFGSAGNCAIVMRFAGHPLRVFHWLVGQA
jgi:hypothetical protein